MLLNQALAQQAGAHSKLEQKLLERKRKRKERERLEDEISGHVDIVSYLSELHTVQSCFPIEQDRLTFLNLFLTLYFDLVFDIFDLVC